MRTLFRGPDSPTLSAFVQLLESGVAGSVGGTVGGSSVGVKVAVSVGGRGVLLGIADAVAAILVNASALAVL